MIGTFGRQRRALRVAVAMFAVFVCVFAMSGSAMAKNHPQPGPHRELPTSRMGHRALNQDDSCEPGAEDAKAPKPGTAARRHHKLEMSTCTATPTKRQLRKAGLLDSSGSAPAPSRAERRMITAPAEADSPDDTDPGDDPGYDPGGDPDDPGDDPADPGDQPGDPGDPADQPGDPGDQPGSDDPENVPTVWCAGLNGGWYYFRTSACSTVTVTQTVFDPSNGELVASMTYLVAREITSEYYSTSWDYHVEYFFLSGELAYEQMQISPDLVCEAHFCDETTSYADSFFDATWMKLEKPLTWDYTLNSQTDFAAPATPVVEYEATTFTLSVEFPNVTGGNPYSDREGTLRCDNVARADSFPGCVFTAGQPVFYMGGWWFDEAANHVADAQAMGAPGALFGDPLHRTTSESVRDANRAVACPSSFPVGEGQQCDEYPFASTYEGGASGGIYSARAISAYDNESSGAMLGNFYGSERVLDHDAFNVVALPECWYGCAT